MGLFSFYKKAGDFVAPDPSAVEKGGDDGKKHSAYHQKIVLISGFFGIVGAVLGAVLLFVATGAEKTGSSTRVPLLAPFLLGAAGLLFGVAVACLIAPREFLTGPLGEKWMKLIGTKSVAVARFVCLILGLIIMAPFVVVGLLIVFGD